MDIMRPRVWRICGWTATALFGGIVCLGAKILHDGHHASAAYFPMLNVMIAACALLTGIRLVAPPLAKLHQAFELNLGLQRRILQPDNPKPGPPSLHLVQNSERARGVDDPRSHVS